ncbi:signal peptidase I [Bittarella massiliensis (ex Durand et al. 2017)]|uniref:Signal peptidase I n=1 Tax=Bittarella massiliensis (ex Durand et al. 2017) TaxID=1720313 RepID=A0AAW5KBC1_9FIRM|nr:signal peptidase I [Bittarella massiliensis (ex Durand et al. 2017)]MCQ4948655.1 signal peptidase I [Bittarella massiliensis (ex Durand et al. 2017)]
MAKKICNTLSALLLAALAAVALAILIPMLLGYREMAVLSGSMEPAIPVGSIVCVKPTKASQLQAGDVCTYLLPDGNTYVTHRVLSVDSEARTLVTQGDANDAPDGEIAFSQVFGRAAFHLPLLGYLTTGIKTPTGIFAACGLVILIILLNFVPAIIAAGEAEKAGAPKSGDA